MSGASSAHLPSTPMAAVGPTQAELLRAHHELEGWLAPWKNEIMGVYVNLLVGHKPVYATAFYIVYTALLWYYVYSDRSVLNLFIYTVVLVALVEFILTVAKLDLRMPANILVIDPSLYTDPTNRLLTFHDICAFLIHFRYWVQAQARRINNYRRTSPVTPPYHGYNKLAWDTADIRRQYFSTVIFSCALIYKLSGILSDRTMIFVSGMFFVALPALHHYRVKGVIQSHYHAMVTSQHFRNLSSKTPLPTTVRRWLEDDAPKSRANRPVTSAGHVHASISSPSSGAQLQAGWTSASSVGATSPIHEPSRGPAASAASSGSTSSSSSPLGVDSGRLPPSSVAARMHAGGPANAAGMPM